MLDSNFYVTVCASFNHAQPQNSQGNFSLRCNDLQAGLLGDQARALGVRGARGRAMGGAAMGALRGLKDLSSANPFPKNTEKTVAAAKELNAFLQGFVEQVWAMQAFYSSMSSMICNALGIENQALRTVVAIQ